MFFEESRLRAALFTTTNQGTARRKNLIKPYVLITFSMDKEEKVVNESGAQNRENLIKPVVSILCFSKGLRRRAAGRPPDGRRTPPGPPKNVIKPVSFSVFGKRKKLGKNTRTMKYVMFIVQRVKDNL